MPQKRAFTALDSHCLPLPMRLLQIAGEKSARNEGNGRMVISIASYSAQQIQIIWLERLNDRKPETSVSCRKECPSMKINIVVLVLAFFAIGIPAIGQNQAPPPPKTYTGNIGAGLALTGGNTDTRSFNLSFEMTRDPKLRNVLKANGFYLRSSANGEAIADMLRLGFRDEYAFSKRVLVYGALGYLRDPFKEMDYLLNPQGGIGFKVVDTDKVAFGLSGGAGGVWEKNKGRDVRSSGTLNAGQSFAYKISDTAKLTQSMACMWKTSGFKDYLYHFDMALVTAIFKHVELKVEFMDDFRNLPPSINIKKNDTAFITSLLYKF
jgi:putative salt-induced outer membrane protein YdiY